MAGSRDQQPFTHGYHESRGRAVLLAANSPLKWWETAISEGTPSRKRYDWSIWRQWPKKTAKILDFGKAESHCLIRTDKSAASALSREEATNDTYTGRSS
jgi:hypothetical protein